MANITINDSHPVHSADVLTKISHFFGVVFAGPVKSKQVDVAKLSAHTLADIGVRREQVAPDYSRFSDDDQRLYWTS